MLRPRIQHPGNEITAAAMTVENRDLIGAAGESPVHGGIHVAHEQFTALADAAAIALDHFIGIDPGDAFQVGVDVYLHRFVFLMMKNMMISGWEAKLTGCRRRGQERTVRTGVLGCRTCKKMMLAAGIES